MRRALLFALVAGAFAALYSPAARADFTDIAPVTVTSTPQTFDGFSNTLTYNPRYKEFIFRGTASNSGPATTMTVTFRKENADIPGGSITVAIGASGSTTFSAGPFLLPNECPTTVGIKLAAGSGASLNVSGRYEHTCKAGTAVPTMGTWALIGLAVVLLGTATLFVVRRRSAIA